MKDKPKTINKGVKFDVADHAKVQAICARRYITFSAYVKEAVREKLAKEKA